MPAYLDTSNTQSWWNGVFASKEFQTLSPQTQQVLRAYAAHSPQSVGQAGPQLQADIQHDPALAAAMRDAYQANALPHTTTTDKILFAIGAGAVGGGLAYAAMSGPAIAAGGEGAAGTLPSTATVGSTGALAPAVAPSTDFAAGTTTAGATGGGILGSLGKYGGVLGDLGGVLTNASAADANARRADAANNARAIAENNAAKVQAAQFNLGLPSVRTNQVARGEVLNTMQDAPLTGDPRIDKFNGGGLVPSAFGPQARQAGQLLASTAMNGLQNPSTDRLTPQEIPPYSPSTLDTIGAGAGLGLDIFSLLSKYGGGMNNGAR